MKKPKMVTGKELEEGLKRIKETAQTFVDIVDADGTGDSDNAHYLFEDVMEALYGTKFWDWYNEQPEYKDKLEKDPLEFEEPKDLDPDAPQIN